MPAVESLILDTARLSADAVVRLQERMLGFEAAVLERLRNFLLTFDTKGGHFVPGESATALLLQIKKELQGVLEMRELDSASREFLDRFDEVGENARAIHGEQNGVQVPKNLVNDAKAFAVDATLYTLKNANIHPKFIEPVRKALFNKINFGGSVREAEEVIKRLILSEPGKLNGALTQWVGQVATDAVNQYEGHVQTAIAIHHNLTGVRYVNSLIETSRPQCVRWVEMQWLTEEELPAEIDWAFEHGSGMVPDTDASTFLVYRGGFRCRHKAIPVDNEQAKKAKGIKPTVPPPKPAPKPTPQPPPEVPPVPTPAPAPPAPTPAPKKRAPKAKKEAPKSDTATLVALVNAFNAIVPAERFITTQPKEVADKVRALIAGQDGAIDVIAKRGTNVTLRAPSQKGKAGTHKMLAATGSTAKIYEVGILEGGVPGSAARSNAYVSFVVEAKQNADFLAVDMDIPPELIAARGWRPVKTRLGDGLSMDLKNGKAGTVAVKDGDVWKPWTVAFMADIRTRSMAPVVTHEVAHVIHNAVDPFPRPILSQAAGKVGVTLNDAPTIYGTSNWSEFWTETFAAYVYANGWLKRTRPQVYGFFEAMCLKYGIDLDTVAKAS